MKRCRNLDSSRLYGVAIMATLVFAGADAAHAFRPNVVAERPPEIYLSGPTQTGKTTEVELDQLAKVDRLCRSWNGAPSGTRYVNGCYIAALDVVVLPAKGVWPSERERQQLREHEWAHARGWRHQDSGRGTDWAASLPPKGASTVLASR